MGNDNIIKRSRRGIWGFVVASACLLIFGSLGWLGRYQYKSDAATAQSNLYQVSLALSTTNAQRAVAENQVQVARALQLASQAQKIYTAEDSSREVAVLLAIESIRMFPSGEASQVLEDDTLAYPVSQVAQQNSVTSVAFSPDGKYAASASYDGTALVWDALTGKEIIHVKSDYGIISMAISPNGKYIVTGDCLRDSYGCSRGVARVWDISSGKEITNVVHDDGVALIVFSPDSKYVITTGCGTVFNADFTCNENFARLWETSTGKEFARLTHTQNPDGPLATLSYISSAAFSADGKYIVTGGCFSDKPGSIRIWESSSGREIEAMDGNCVTSVAFSPNGGYVASGGQDNAARVWRIGVWDNGVVVRIGAGKEISHIAFDGDVTSVAFSPDSQYVAATGGTTIRVWNATTGNETTRISSEGYYPGGYYPGRVVFSPDGKHILSTMGNTSRINNTVRVWDAMTGKEVSRMIHNSWIDSVAFSPDGNYVVSGGDNGIARVWRIANQDNIQLIHQTSYSWVNLGFVFIANGKILVSIGEHPIWDVSTGKEISLMAGCCIYPYVPYINSNGKTMVSISGADTAVIWDISTSKKITRISAPGIRTLALSADGKYVATGGYTDHVIRVWEISTSKELMLVTDNNNSDFSLALSPDGKYVAASGPLVMQVWEVSTGKEIARIRKEYQQTDWGGNSIISVAFSPDGKYLVSSRSLDPFIYVWEVSTGKKFMYSPPGGGVRSIAFSPNSKYLISSGDKIVSIWELSTGQEISRRSGFVSAVAFSADGKYALSAIDEYGTLHKWLWRSEDIIADACLRVTRNLTRDEWRHFIGDALPYQAVCPNLPIESAPTPVPTPTIYLSPTQIPTLPPYLMPPTPVTPSPFYIPPTPITAIP